MSRIALIVIRLYQLLISPLLGPSCRFSPTCSQYTAISISRFGLARGLLLGFKRILRCHPWGATGYDPPPEKNDISNEKIEENLVWTGKS
jgi:hypothetical protein